MAAFNRGRSAGILSSRDTSGVVALPSLTLRLIPIHGQEEIQASPSTRCQALQYGALLP